jgi:phenol 2-monooxygenase
MLEINLWNPDDNGQIQRSDRIPDTTPGISRFQQVVLHQGRIERFFLDSIAEHSDIRVERGILPESMKFDPTKADDDNAYPIEVTLRHLTEEEATAVQDGLFRSNLTPDDTADLLAASKLKDKAGAVETIRAKYVVGCDGAHSWVRNWLGYELRGVRT